MLIIAATFASRVGRRVDTAHATQHITLLSGVGHNLVHFDGVACEPVSGDAFEHYVSSIDEHLSIHFVRTGTPAVAFGAVQAEFDESIAREALGHPDAFVQNFTDELDVAWSISDPSEGGCRVLVTAHAAGFLDFLEGKAAIWFGISIAVLIWFLVWFSAGLGHWINLRLKERSRLVIENVLKLEETRSALAIEQQRSELRKEFLTVTSHQFKTPLASILSAAEVLERYGDRLTTSQREGRVSKIRSQVNRLNHMVNEILELSRVMNDSKAATFDTIRVDELVQDLVKDQLQISGESHDIHSELEPVTASVEPRLLEQAVENLLSNAVKYTPEGGKIVIKVRNLGDWFRLSVTDEGIGIPESELTTLFTPFARASNVGERAGTGIGLAIVDECVSLHAGEIKVESDLNEGTSFVITIPKERTSTSSPGLSSSRTGSSIQRRWSPDVDS